MAAPTKIFCVLAKLQASAGTDAAPTAAANAVRLLNTPTIKVKYLEEGDRKGETHAGLGDLGTVGRFGRSIDLTVQLALKGAGADYFTTTNNPESDPFWQAAGLTVTRSGGSGSGKLVYTTADASDTFPLLTLYAYSQYKLYKIIDCVVAPKITLDNMKKGVIDFAVSGRLATDPVDSAMPTGLAFSAVVPPVFAGNQNSIGTFTSAATPNPLLTRQAVIDFGTSHAPMTGGGAPDGLAGFIITDRVMKHTATIQSVPLAALAVHAIARQATNNGGVDTSSTYVLGAAGVFNRATIQLGQWACEPGDGDASGIGTTQLAGAIAARSLGGSSAAVGREIAIIFD